MTDQELRDYSKEHILYEMSKLYGIADRLVKDAAVRSDPILKNALIVSFAVHARSLASFLYPEETTKHPDDVTSDEYVKDVQQWRQDRGIVPPGLRTVIRRTNKEIAHLTDKRLPPGAPQKVWTLELIAREFVAPLRQFAAHAEANRLDAQVSAFIANLPASGVAAPPAIPPASTPAGQVTSYTDVSTP